MTKQGNSTISSELDSLCSSSQYLDEYIEEHYRDSGEYPMVVEVDEVEQYGARYPNILYQVDAEAFVHVYGDKGRSIKYNTIEPTIEDLETYSNFVNILQRESASIDPPDSDSRDDRMSYVDNLIDNSLFTEESSGSIDRLKSFVGSAMIVSEEEYERISYTVKRNIAGLGEIDVIMKDSNNEDIHLIGHNRVFVDHAAFGLIETTVEFSGENYYQQWLKNLGEQMNSPITDSNPIVDATLPDGSRVNIVYSDDVSLKGPTVTIRQGTEVPLSILQITKWGTLSPKMAAYLWLCLENEQTVFVIGETASGKTTTLNSITSFIPRDSKIYTAEDTAEVLPPHDTWQQLLTRDSGNESTDVKMNELVEAALRARPDYIIVGEVRGSEAKQAFNAAQTGHPIMLTFHASDIKSAIQRFNNEPMNVPKTDIINADVFLFQNRVKRESDNEIIRRVTEINEVVGYDGERDSIINKQAFKWDATRDEHEFTGLNNSYVLENNIAELLGYEDKKKIYQELDRRTKIIERLIENDIVGYEEVNNTLQTIYNDGIEAIDFIETTDLVKDR